jgi:hypothetical protein
MKYLVALARATPLCTFNTRHYKAFNLELCQPYFKVRTPEVSLRRDRRGCSRPPLLTSPQCRWVS